MPSSSPLMGGERRGQSTLALAAAALCAVALVGATASWAQSQATALEQFEIIPLGAMQRPRFVGLHLGDDLAKNLPAERVYETDGVAPKPRCPGAWCETNPFRVYPDGREEFGVAKDFPLTWASCNIAIQDC